MKAIMIAWLSVATLASAQTWHRVAYDDAGNSDKQPHLAESGGDWRFENPGTDEEELRTCAFGQRVTFDYAGLNGQASYKAKLRFFSDGEREVRVKAGDTILLPAVKMTAGKPVEVEVALPSSTNLTLAIEHVAGPNAAVSSVEILSTDPRALGVIAPPPFPLPQLSPRPVDGEAVNLAGTWRFNGTNAIQVPGEWVMQGFTVKAGEAAHYERDFKVPASWRGKRIKLRCDAVYSDAKVWINGREAGRHLGGFTPFELDVTELVKLGGENVIALDVINESEADTLASGSMYACHQLGGITRGIRLFALPEVSLSSLRVATKFDAAFENATLELDLAATGEAAAALTLTAPDGRRVPLTPDHVATGHVSIPVAQPMKWDNEHPNLYTLTVKLEVAGRTVETVVQRVGFRQIEVRGNQLFVNNRPVKLRGSNHHEVYPVTGRSLPTGIHRRDIELFREGNVNLLRTCHYPPDEALMEAADELGMFIECEAPICWAPGSGHKEYVLQATAEMVLNYRNHPSVLYWSLANESGWGAHFVASSKLARQLDPTRPQTFNNPGDQRFTEIANLHYPGHGGPNHARRNTKNPVYHGEDSHLNAYNRLELATDPALRDLWGRYVRELWDDIYATEGDLGQSIWSGVDDTFYIGKDQTVGYGTWGPIDGWRREKPEYWGMKKAYSPVRILHAVAATGLVLQVEVENRQNFSNLREMKIAWSLGGKSGFTTADLAPGAKGILPIGLAHAPKPGDTLKLSFFDPRGFLADQFDLALEGAAKPTPPVAERAPAVLSESGEAITVTSGATTWRIDRKSGQLTSMGKLALAGPALMLLPLNNAGETQMTGATKVWKPFTAPCTGWSCTNVSAKQADGVVTVAIAGTYSGAEGSYTLTFRGGELEVAYDFTITQAVNPRQVGLVFTLPRECEVLSWERRGYWDVYPADHIARLKGTVKASEGFEATSVGPRTKPAHPWRLDNLPYGNNDFCSTKHNVLHATVLNEAGRGLAIDGQGQQHVRCWRTEDAVHVLIADYSNGGSERFLRGLANKDDRPLKPGAKVVGAMHLETR